VVRQRSRGKLTCRERIACCSMTGTFREVGSLAGSQLRRRGRVADFTPANHVGGWGKIDGRRASSAPTTSRRAAVTPTARSAPRAAISTGCRSNCASLGAPARRIVRRRQRGGDGAAAAEAGESVAQGELGAIKAAAARDGAAARSAGPPRQRHVRAAAVDGAGGNMLLGSVVGIGAAKAVLGHFSVMVRDIAQLFVAGPPVVSHAMGYDITKEDLGGWHIHCRTVGRQPRRDREEAAAMTEAFPVVPAVERLRGAAVLAPIRPIRRTRDEELLHADSAQAHDDVRRATRDRLMADADSFFEIGSLWGTDQIVGFVRFNGHPLGVIASDSRHVNGGALTATVRQLKRHLDLCDLFHVPVLSLIDNPGFAVGLEHEIAGTIRKGGEWMVAFAQVNVPIFSVLMRRSFGVAGNNFATPLARASVRVAWPAADVGGIPPEGGIEAAYKRQLAKRPTRRVACRDQRAHRERARTDRAAQPLPDRRDDRSARHAEARVRMGRERVSHRASTGGPRVAAIAVQAVATQRATDGAWHRPPLVVVSGADGSEASVSREPLDDASQLGK
jgi:acetyl-CoA carboxylase carboxyltransferase component